MDPFEEKLKTQRFREAPAEWRAELLAQARRAQAGVHAAAQDDEQIKAAGWAWTLGGWRSRLATLLWPCPQAWGALAAVWLVLLAMHYMGGSRVALSASGHAPAMPAIVTALKEQERVLAEVTGPLPAPVERSSKSIQLGPRSEASNSFLET